MRIQRKRKKNLRLKTNSNPTGEAQPANYLMSRTDYSTQLQCQLVNAKQANDELTPAQKESQGNRPSKPLSSHRETEGLPASGCVLRSTRGLCMQFPR
jgi:hypothetical protein